MLDFEISLDELKIDASELEPKRWTGIFKRLMGDKVADDQRLYDAGKNPDGGAQKRYKASYRRRINQKGGYRPVKGRPAKVNETPNLEITGDFRGSTHVVEREPGVVEALFGAGRHYSGLSFGALAKALEKMGFKFHYWSKKNIAYIETEAGKELDAKLKKVFTVKKRN